MKRKISLTNKIVFLFGLLAIIVGCNYIVLLDTEKKAGEQQNWVLHTHQVIEESEKFLGALRDAEIGQRGFLLTLNKSYLEPYNSGTMHANSKLTLLKKLTKDNSGQQTRLALIQDLISKKFLELEETIQLAQQGKFAEALQIVNSNSGKIVMDNIRKHIGELISVEENLLSQRTAASLKDRSDLNMLFLSEVTLLIMLIFICYFIIQKIIVRPLNAMTAYIANEGNKIDGTGIKIKKRRDEIGFLVNAFNGMQSDLEKKDNEKNKLINELQIALNEVKNLKGIIPICSYCHKIRNDEGAWDRLEAYISKHSEAQFSHGICPSCSARELEKIKPS